MFGELAKRHLSLSQLRRGLEVANEARFRDYMLIDLATVGVKKAILSEKVSEYSDVCSVVSCLSRLQVPDRSLTEMVIGRLNADDLSLKSLLLLVRSSLGVVNPEQLLPFVQNITESICVLNYKSDLLDTAMILDSVFDLLPNGQELLVQISNRLVVIRGDPSKYDVPAMAEIFSRRAIRDPKAWKCVIADIKFMLEDFEPVDLVKTARICKSMSAEVIGERSSDLANSLAEWSLKRWEEFDKTQWDELKAHLSSDQSFSCNPWYHEELQKWGPNRSLANMNSSSSVKSV